MKDDERRASFTASVVLTYGSSVGVACLSLVNVLLVARALGAEGRGTVTFLTTIAMMTSQLGSLGVEEASANVVGSRADQRATVAGNAVALAILLGFAAAGLVAGLIALFPSVGGGSDPLLRWLALATIPVLILQFYLQFIIRADYGFGVVNAASLLAPVLNVVVNTALIVTGLITVETALITWIAGQLIATGMLLRHVHRRLAGFGAPSARLARGTLGFGLKAHAGRIMKTGNYRLDQWILGSVAGPRELGLYSVAVAWAEALFFLPEALAAVLRPDLVRASAADAGRRTAAVFRVAVLLSLPVVAIFVVAAPVLCVVAFGDEFAGSVDDLRVLAPGAFGIVAMKVLANALVAQGHPMLSNAAIAVAFVLTVGLDILLIPSHGGLGAAIASTAAYTGGGIAVALIFARTLRLSVRSLVPGRRDARTLAASARRPEPAG
jgi:O-antigen/teichoic acid export membrane protein